MDDAKIVDKADGWWVILTMEGQRYYLRDDQMAGRRKPFIGQKGRIGYMQSTVSMVQTFIAEEE